MPKYLDMHGLETLTGDIEATYLRKNKRGAANGVASLDSNGKVPVSQIPGGAGGTSDYTDLDNKPQINGTTLSGNKTSANLGIHDIPSGGTTGQVLAKSSDSNYAVQWVNQQGGGGGTTDYADLDNKPQINGTTLSGNKTTANLGIHDVPAGGTAGQVLAKASGTDHDVEWVTPEEPASPDDIVVVSDTTPTDPDARIWFPETPPQGIQVPTYAEFQEVEADVSELKTEITNGGNVLGTLVMDDSVPSINLFDKTSSRNSSGQFYSLDGSLNTGVQSKYCTSHPIFVGAGTYKFTASYDTFGENTVAIPVLDTNGNVIGTNNGELTDSNATVTVTFTKPCIVKFNFLDSKINNIKFSLEDGYPSNYVSGEKQKASAICEANSALGEAKSILEAQLNMFNKDSTENLSGEYWRINGTHSTGQSASLCLSHPIVIPAGTYKFHGSSTFGGNEGAVSVFDTSGAIIKVIPATVTSHVCEFTVERVSIVRFNYASANAESIVFCKSALWDGAYHAYSKMIDRTFLHDVEKTDTTFFSRVKSINLLDMSNPIVGSYFKAADGTIVAYSNRVIKSAYIKLDGAGTYVTKVTKKLFGSNANKLALFDANKAYVKTITGTLVDDSNTYSALATFTIAEVDITDGAVYVGLSIEDNYVGNTMFVKSSTYPAIYVPFYDYWRVSGLNVENGQAIEYDLNPLYGKTAVFDGDSICNGATDTSGNGSYAGRITTKNMMGNHNYAVSGGTLTAELYNDGGNARHWVSRTVDTMYADFPNADYIIFEGGTNDADLIGSILDSQNLPAKYGSFTANDFSGSYDDETFCGAVESIIYKAMSHWPHSKIGFVIAMKMGKTVETFNNRRAYFQTVMDICKKWGVPFINLWDECPMNPWLDSCFDGDMTIEENIEAHKLYKDGQHPTPDGYARITPIIEAWMKTL